MFRFSLEERYVHLSGGGRIGPNPCCLFLWLLLFLEGPSDSSETLNHNLLDTGHVVP